MNLYIGFDIGGTKCSVVGGTDDIEILERIRFENKMMNGPHHILSELIEGAKRIIAKYPTYKLVAAGISCGGPLDINNGIILSPPNLPGWKNIEIVKLIKNKLCVPVFLQNDANACALAEWKFGAGKGYRNMIFLTFGTGLGAGLILNGKLYSGTNDLAGEIGHIRLAEEGPKAYGKHGSFEAFCSGSGISRWAKELIKEKMKQGEIISFIKNENEIDSITTKLLAEEASKGNSFALDLFKESAGYLGKGLSILIDVLNPELIVIGSIYSRNTDLFEEEMLKVIRNESLSSASKVCKVVPAVLGDSVGDFASLSVAIDGCANNKEKIFYGEQYSG
jgi:glucokinase